MIVITTKRKITKVEKTTPNEFLSDLKTLEKEGEEFTVFKILQELEVGCMSVIVNDKMYCFSRQYELKEVLDQYQVKLKKSKLYKGYYIRKR